MKAQGKVPRVLPEPLVWLRKWNAELLQTVSLLKDTFLLINSLQEGLNISAERLGFDVQSLTLHAYNEYINWKIKINSVAEKDLCQAKRQKITPINTPLRPTA